MTDALPAARRHFVHDHVFAERIAALPSRPSPAEEEHARLARAVAALQAQLGAERQRRARLEEEQALARAELGELERRLAAAGAHRARALELEAEAAELRRALRAARPAPESPLPPLPAPGGASLLDELLQTGAPAARALRRSSSDSALERARGPEARGAGAAGPRGGCPLREADTQHRALSARYERLLRRCQPPGGRAHKAVQTARAAPAPEPAEPAEPAGAPPPEYKALFQELFSCIAKSKREMDAQRAKHRAAPSHS